MKNISKIFIMFFAFLAISAYLAVHVSAVNIEVTSVEINNRYIFEDTGNHTNNYKYQRGENINVDVCVKALADVQDAQIDADILGYRYSNQNPGKVSDTTDTFDLSEGDNDCFTLRLQIPDNIDQDYYKLRVRAADRDGVSFEQDFELHIEGASRSNAIQIKDFSLDPQQVVAGRAFTAMVKVKNIGDKDLTDLKVTISVPELNIKTSEYMDSLNADESKTFEELLLRVPECTKKGTYTVDIQIDFDEYEQTTTSTTIDVTTGDMCAGTTTGNDNTNTGTTPPAQTSVITIPNSQEISQGTSVAYPIMIQNKAATAQSYVMSLSGISTWGSARIDPSSVIVVPAGQSATGYLYVSVNPNTALGDQSFTLTVNSGTDSKQIPLLARVTKNGNAASTDWSKYRNGLEIGLVVLVVILIIIGLIIGFNKSKDNKKETEPYY